MTTEKFTNRNEYLTWKNEWKLAYLELSSEIRKLKGSRKKFAYRYRSPGDKTNKKRVIVGTNPRFDQAASWNLINLKWRAKQMMMELTDAKDAAVRQFIASQAKEKN